MAETDDKTAQVPEEEVTIIETDEAGNPPQQAAAPDAGEDDDHEDDDRLAGSQDDYDEDVASGDDNPARKRRVKRRELQRRARDRAQEELAMLRQHAAMLEQRLQGLEGSAVQSTAHNYQSEYQRAYAEAQQAEEIIQRASDAGNVADALAAKDIRDAALARMRQAEQGYNQVQAYVQQQQVPAAAPQGPQLDPGTQRWATEWLQANPWYDPNGGDEDSAIATAIEQAMAKQGYDPSTRAYWEELTRRVSARLGGGDDTSGGARQQGQRRGPPPQGMGREHAGNSGGRGGQTYYVTPERKAAMIEAGIWDDVPRRNQMLKQYAEYDRNQSASR